MSRKHDIANIEALVILYQKKNVPDFITLFHRNFPNIFPRRNKVEPRLFTFIL